MGGISLRLQPPLSHQLLHGRRAPALHGDHHCLENPPCTFCSASKAQPLSLVISSTWVDVGTSSFAP